MNSITSVISNPENAAFIALLTELEVNAVPKELRGEDEERYFSVKVSLRSRPDSWAVLINNKAYNSNLESEYESLPSSRTDEFINEFRFPLLEAVSIAERLAEQRTLRGITVQDIIMHGGFDAAYQAIHPPVPEKLVPLYRQDD
jgi:hypothetical protein